MLITGSTYSDPKLIQRTDLQVYKSRDVTTPCHTNASKQNQNLRVVGRTKCTSKISKLSIAVTIHGHSCSCLNVILNTRTEIKCWEVLVGEFADAKWRSFRECGKMGVEGGLDGECYAMVDQRVSHR